MDAIIGTIIGACIAGIAMLLNSYYAAKRREDHENNVARRNQLIKDLGDLERTYQSALQILDRQIRMKGFDSKAKLEELYKINIAFKLSASKEVYDKFSDTRNAIANMAKKLTPLPEEFIPKFEEDRERMARLEARKEAENIRNEEAKEYIPDLMKLHDELADLMKKDLEKHKKLTP